MFEVEVLKIKGKKYAVLPYEDYENLMEKLEDSVDVQDILETQKRILRGEERTVPGEVVHAVYIDGVNKIKAFREYRKMSQVELAEKIFRSVETIRKIEQGKTDSSIRTLKSIAKALDVEVEQII